MGFMNAALQAGSVCGHDHLVSFYDSEDFLLDAVCAFLGPALLDDGAAIVVATPAHRTRFEAALRAAGIDVDAATREDRYIALDAATVLASFMVDGRPDPTRFRAAVGAVMDRASRGGRELRVYGEMVVLLWEAGDADSTLALEDLWNDFAAVRAFQLLCAYPMRVFDDEHDSAAFERICEQHTAVIPTESYSLLVDPAQRSRAIARLQQQTSALQAELLRLSAHGPSDGPTVEVDDGGHDRDEAGERRDSAGDRRDQAATARDEAADRRDDAAEQRDDAAERSEASAGDDRASRFQSPSAVARREAASDRLRASQDRRDGANERVQAESDRDTAHADRGASALDREYSSDDDLTGAYRRGPGIVELNREIRRARRNQTTTVLAFVDVDGLKAVNDSFGHAAGDRMLREVADALQANLRSHDLVIRYGGDEFICAASGLTLADAQRRLARVNAGLAVGSSRGGTVTVGLAELLPHESTEDVIARADVALYRERRQSRPSLV